MEQTKKTKEYIVSKENNSYIYYYKNMADVSNAVLTMKNLMKQSFQTNHVLLPESIDKAEECIAEYAINKEEIYLFDTMYDMPKLHLTGGGETILSHSDKMDLILQLCEAFEELNDKGIMIKHIDQKSLLYNPRLNHVSIDLINVLTKKEVVYPYGMTQFNITNNVLFTKKSKVLGISFSKAQELNNNVFLGLLIYKILWNLPWFKDVALKDVLSIIKTSDDALNQLFYMKYYDELITKDFYEDLLLVLQNKEPNKTLKQHPKDYITQIKKTACICNNGYFHKIEGQLYCDRCNAIKQGTILFKNTSASYPLVFPYIYELSSIFQIQDTSYVIRTASKDDTYGIFIPIDESDVKVFDQDNQTLSLEKNSKGDYYKILFDTANPYTRTIVFDQQYSILITNQVERNDE